jgi:hypothetical protein
MGSLQMELVRGGGKVRRPHSQWAVVLRGGKTETRRCGHEAEVMVMVRSLRTPEPCDAGRGLLGAWEGSWNLGVRL